MGFQDNVLTNEILNAVLNEEMCRMGIINTSMTKLEELEISLTGGVIPGKAWVCAITKSPAETGQDVSEQMSWSSLQTLKKKYLTSIDSFPEDMPSPEMTNLSQASRIVSNNGEENSRVQLAKMQR